MPFKPNYRLERATRARKKEERKLEKIEAREAKRKAKAALEAPGGEPHVDERAQKED
ncbi:MAG: hypothetical protein ACKOEE_16720 [Tagaea sp.]|jgi:hypothetical protein|nr:hypothetical protein [Azospirillum sp.]MCA3266302.1 hypothetical protein [Azospirillum sp.]MCZ8124015.1 hypothetical protein [Magnetospirillum sp.]